MKLTAYLITWVDSGAEKTWRHVDYIKNDLSVIHSIGWLVKQDRKAVTITTSLSECDSAIDALTIPRVAIRRMQRLRHTAGS